MMLINIMLGKGLGGIEQAALAYHEALKLRAEPVLSLLHSRSRMRPAFDAAALPYATLSPYGEWDLFAARKLRQIATKHAAKAIICHGNRAIGLGQKALLRRIPVIGVAHNYKIRKRFPKCDGVLCITRDLIEECVLLDMPRSKLFHVPNMTNLPVINQRTTLRDPVVIGTMGRFVSKKGMDVFLQALHALRQQDIAFRAIIGGDGPLAPALMQQAKQLSIDDTVEFIGWVKDKPAFFEALDIFALPSQHEPFGIVLIEAMAAGLPCVTTDTEGPCEIITHEVNALMVEKMQPHAMAQALRELIEAPEYSLELGIAARQKIASHFNPDIVGMLISEALQQLTVSTR